MERAETISEGAGRVSEGAEWALEGAGGPWSQVVNDHPTDLGTHALIESIRRDEKKPEPSVEIP